MKNHVHTSYVIPELNNNKRKEKKRNSESLITNQRTEPRLFWEKETENSSKVLKNRFGKEERKKREYQEIGEGDEISDQKPLEAVADESQKSGDEENERQRQVKQSQARGPAEDFAEIGGGGEVIKLNLRNG